MSYDGLTLEQIWASVKPKDGYVHALTIAFEHIFYDSERIENILYALQHAQYEVIDVKPVSIGIRTNAVIILYK